MSEYGPDKEKLEGLCEHGNLLTTCEKCRRASEPELKQRTRAEFFEQTVKQKIGIAKTLSAIEQQARLAGGNFDYEQLVSRAADEYGLDSHQQELIKNGIFEFRERNAAISRYIEQYRDQFGSDWQQAMFRDCFGSQPKGEVEVRVGPVTLYWQCQELEDYAKAVDLPAEEAGQSFGFRKSPLDFHLAGLRGTMIIEYAGYPEHQRQTEEVQEKKSRITETHEEQHIIYDLMPRQLDYRALDFPGLDENSSQEEIAERVKDYLRLRRQEIEESVKNEILAYWRDGEKEPRQIYETVLEPGGMYDNTGMISEKSVVAYLVSRFGERYGEVVKKLEVNKQWAEECRKYRDHVNQAVETIKQIEADQPEKKLEYIYLLMLEPLDKWQRARRITQEKI